MNKLNYLLLLIVHAMGGCTASGQLGVKTYAFEQVSLPGIIPSGVTDEAGNPVSNAKAGQTISYYIYLSYASTSAMTPLSLWIQGQPFAFKTESVAKTPVIHVNPNRPEQLTTQTLVPETKEKVIRLLVSGKGRQPTGMTAGEQKRIQDSAVVVRYQWRGKIYHAASSKLGTLEPLMHQ